MTASIRLFSSSRRLVLLAALVVTAWCTAPNAFAQAKAEPLRIGYQKYGTLTILKARGDLEKRLASQGIEVQLERVPGRPAAARRR